ncbi:glutamate receptor 4-like isoform X1 [Maniola hyperantus]|uniref:glutamate receptor 4-like isoform X1 n=1 Tax=Aphantopus hyperantus TaxID=2795564 RepID=UPI001569ED5B|nr:glutamate receptor 2-like [Maniola hyperantus]
MTSITSSGILLFLFILRYRNAEAAHSTRYPIGGLFNSKTFPSSEQAFENIVNLGATKAYYGRVIHSQVDDSYSTALEICEHTSDNKGVVALIDARPMGDICDYTCMICNSLNITYLTLGWEPPITLDTDLFSFSYHPPPNMISKAFATLIKKLQWDKFTIFYEDDTSFVRLQEVINTWPYTSDQILYSKLNPDEDNLETFKYIFKVAHMSYHVLDCDAKNILKYMREIVQVDNSTQYQQSFILTALDAYTVRLDDIDELLANVSTMHLTTANDVNWKDMDMSGIVIRLETALAADALNHLEKALRSMGMAEDIDNPPALCFKDAKIDYLNAAWPKGDDLRKALIKTTTKGFTGNIQFNEFGQRINFRLHYSKLNNESEFIHVGHWDSTTDLITDEKEVKERSSTSKSVIRVASKMGKPYFDVVQVNGTTTFRGYAVDLMQNIYEHMVKNDLINKDLRYEFYRVNGDLYGNPIAGTKKWDGLIGDLIEHNAELAICDITISSDRNAVVDFSHPFMSLGISLVIKEPEPVEPDMFSFMNPLSLDVWLYLATTYIIVSFVLLICARMSPDDWVNPHPCNQNPENLQNIWSLYNCMWLTMGSIMTQGCDILPRAAASRWVTGMWWFFALIVTASYTANMSTFVSASRRNNEIKGAKDLVEQNSIAYGTVDNASTYQFFEKTNDTVYKKLWAVMKSAKPTVFTTTNEEGVNRVRQSKGKYAFFMESSQLEYAMQRYCDLKMVGPKLDSKDYGIAMPKNSPYKNGIDAAIIALQASGTLLKLKKTWWEDMDIEEKCQKNDDDEEDNGSLQMKNTSGIFIVLAFGGGVGFIVAVIDFLLYANKICVKEKVTFKEALLSEWRASLDPRALHRLAAPPRSAAPSTASPSPQRERSQSRAVSVLRAATSFINFDEIY